jgi:hypothetical protein
LTAIGRRCDEHLLFTAVTGDGPAVDPRDGQETITIDRETRDAFFDQRIAVWGMKRSLHAPVREW